MRAQLASLPPLHVSRHPSRDGGQPEVLSSALYRKTDQLLETLLQMSANVKVVDVTGKSPGQCWEAAGRLPILVHCRFPETTATKLTLLLLQ